MNIDSSSLLSLLSSDNSLEKLQQATQYNNEIQKEFADTLLEKIKQINGLNEGDNVVENIAINIPETTDKLHGLAGWLNDESVAIGLSNLFGKDLPKSSILENDIDLENTLESLVNVILALEEVEFNSDEIQTKLTTVVEKVEAIKFNVPEQIDLGEKLNQLVQEVQEIKKDISKNLEINVASHVKKIVMEGEDNSSQLTNKSLVVGTNNPNNDEKLGVPEKPDLETDELKNLTKERLFPTNTQNKKEFNIKQPVVDSSENLPNEIAHVTNQQLQEKSQFLSEELTTRIVKVVASLEHIADSLSEDEALADLESQIKFLTTDVNSIQEALNQNLPVTLTESKLNKDLTNQFDKTDIKEEDATNQVNGIAAQLTEPFKQERVVAESQLVGQFLQEEKPEIKKEHLSLKQMTEERSLNFSIKGQNDSLLQQENFFSKPVIDNPVISTIQNEKADLFETNDLNQSHEKGVLKFVNDFSNLNKLMMLGNKAEIPPMNKHFAHPEWNKEFGERVIWMHKQAIPSAELRLNPKHLGPITIKLDVTQDQATVAFTAQHAAVKEAIDTAIPKLREMFSAQQLNLVDVNVSQENLDQRHSRGYSQLWGEQGNSDDQDSENVDEKEQTNTAMEIVDEIESGRAIASNGVLSIFA